MTARACLCGRTDLVTLSAYAGAEPQPMCSDCRRAWRRCVVLARPAETWAYLAPRSAVSADGSPQSPCGGDVAIVTSRGAA